ncbi:MAG: group 1 truncated hemoglobin [Betaproteobacteria bacterium]
MQTKKTRFAMTFLLPFLFALGHIAFATNAAADTLYDRLGGEKVIVKFVDETIDLTANDPKTRRSFDKINLVNLKKKIVEHICELSQGPCKYSGDPMKPVHKGLDIQESEFYGMVEHLRTALGNAGVDEGPKNELLKILAPMKRDIVTK